MTVMFLVKIFLFFQLKFLKLKMILNMLIFNLQILYK